MKGKTYAKLRRAALVILGAEAIALCALIGASSHASLIARHDFLTRHRPASKIAPQFNSDEKGYGNWAAVHDFAAAIACGEDSRSCTGSENTDLESYNPANPFDGATQSSNDNDEYQGGGESSNFGDGPGSGGRPSDGAFEGASNSPFGQLFGGQFGPSGAGTGSGPQTIGPTGTGTGSGPQTISLADLPDIDFIDQNSPNGDPDSDHGPSPAPAVVTNKVPEPDTLPLFCAGLIGAVSLYRRKKSRCRTPQKD